MQEIIEDFKSVELTKLQKFIAILGIVLVILANTNIKPTDYHKYVRDSGNVTNLYFATVFTNGDAVALGVFNQFVRIK